MDAFLLSSIFALSFTFGLSVFIFIQHPKSFLHQLFSVFLLMLTLWIFGDIFFLTPLIAYQTPLFWYKLSHFGATLCTGFYFHFIVHFTQTRLKPIFLYLSYGLAIFFNLSNIFDFEFFKSVTYTQGHPTLTMSTGVVYDLFSVYVISVAILALGFAIWRLRNSTGHLRDQMRYFLWGTVIIMVSVVAFFMGIAENANFRFDNVCVVLYVSMIMYALTKKQLLDINLIISRTMANLVSAGIYLSVAITTLLLFRFYISEYITFSLIMVVSILLLTTGFTFEKLRLRIITTAEKLFLRGHYSFRVVLGKFSDGFSKSTSLEDVVHVVETHFGDDAEFSDVRVAFPEFYEMKHETQDRFVDFRHPESSFTISQYPALTAMVQANATLSTRDSDHDVQTLKLLGAHAVIPCFSPSGDLICLILLGKKLSEDPINSDDIDLFNAVRLQIPQALDRIVQTKKSAELTVAQNIQMDILPKSPTISGMDLACFMQPADEVGGDYYDVINVGGYSWIFLGDVTGHGLASGLVMFMVQSIITSILHSTPTISPKDLNHAANQILYANLQRLQEQRPMTIASLRFDPTTRQVVASGCHDNLLIYRANLGSFETIALDHFPLGLGFTDILTAADFQQIEFGLNPGDILLVISDGITEAVARGDVDAEYYGEDRLKNVVLANLGESAEAIKGKLVEDLEEFSAGVFHDDVTFIVAKVV